MWQKIETFLMRAKDDNSEVKVFGYADKDAGSFDIGASHRPITGNKKLMTRDKKTVKPVGDGSYVVIETKKILRPADEQNVAKLLAWFHVPMEKLAMPAEDQKLRLAEACA
jgi:hypothetical protein